MPSERGLTIIGIATVVLAFSAIVVATVIKGGPTVLQAPSVVGLLGFLSTLVGLFITILKVDGVGTKVNNVQANVDDVQQKINGHLQQHIEQARQEGASANGGGTPPA